MSKILYQRWDKVYRICKKKLGFEVNKQINFGVIQSFEKKNLGQYHVVKNISYAEKKGSPWVDKAREGKNIKLPFNSNLFHFAQMPYFQLISFIDLDRSSMILPQQNQSEATIKDNQFQTSHIMKISKSHIAHGHSIFIPYLRQCLPQMLTPRLIESIIKLSGIIPGQKIGYNSQGGGSTVNHFHVQMLNGSSLLESNTFYFQGMEGKPITTLVAKTQGIPIARLQVSSFEYIGALFIRIKCGGYKIFEPEVLKSVTDAVWSVVQIALQNSVPHNINVPNEHEVYIILRNFADNNIRYGWVQFSGVQIISNEIEFQKINQQQITKRYAKLALPRSFIEGSLREH